MNTLHEKYKPEDGRYVAAKVIGAVADFAIDELADGRGGIIRLMPRNCLEDITAVYRSSSGSVMVAQLNDHCGDDDMPSTVDFDEESIEEIIRFIKNP